MFINSSKTITIDDLRKYFHLPIAEVARQFGTCTTALKKICRRLNITKWPYRQILSLTKSIQSLEMASLNDGVAPELRAQYRDQITVLQNTIGEVMKNPNKAIDTLNGTINNEDSGELKVLDGKIEEDEDQNHSSTQSAQVQGESSFDKRTNKAYKRISSQFDNSIIGTSKHPRPNELNSPVVAPLFEVEGNKTKEEPRLTFVLPNKTEADGNNSNNLMFFGQVKLAPLLRKQSNRSSLAKIVPLMEPDIGSNFLIQFIPKFVSSDFEEGKA